MILTRVGRSHRKGFTQQKSRSLSYFARGSIVLRPQSRRPQAARLEDDMGEMIKFDCPDGSAADGYLAGSPGIALGRRRHPGMVGPQRSDQGNGRPLRRSRFHRAGTRSLPRPGDAGARRGQPHDGRAGLGRGDRGRDPRRVQEAQGKLRQGRRDGVLPGRRAHRHCLRETP